MEAAAEYKVTCCRVFVAHFMKSPEQLHGEDAFLLHLMRERKAGPACVGVYVAALRFLYRQVLTIPEVVGGIPRPRVPKTMPDVLSQGEIVQVLGAMRSLKLRTILTMAYAAGLRIFEALHMRVDAVAAVNPAAGTSVWNRGADSAAGLQPNGKALASRHNHAQEIATSFPI